jgi:hypothetical protein
MISFKEFSPVPPEKTKAGDTHGRLTAIEFAGMSKFGTRLWKFQCSCGSETVVPARAVRSGNTKSCGCLRVEQVIKTGHANTTHGMSETTEYVIWHGMLQRCLYPASPAFEQYGGRGITVCDRWRTFENFYADVGPRPSTSHEIDRIDNDGNYEPENVRWTTKTAQARNRRNSVIVQHEGLPVTLIALCEKLGIDYTLASARLRKGWPLAQALYRPLRNRL